MHILAWERKSILASGNYYAMLIFGIFKSFPTFNPSLLFHLVIENIFATWRNEGWYARVYEAREGVIDTDEQAWKRRSIKAWSMTTWFCTVRIYKWWLACLKYGLSKSILFWNTGLKNQKFPFENIFSHNIISSSRVNNRCSKRDAEGGI